MLRPGMVPRTLPFAPRARFPAVLVPGRGGADTVSPSLGPPPTADVRPCTAREDGRTRRSGAGVDTRTHSRCAGGARRETRSAKCKVPGQRGAGVQYAHLLRWAETSRAREASRRWGRGTGVEALTPPSGSGSHRRRAGAPLSRVQFPARATAFPPLRPGPALRSHVCADWSVRDLEGWGRACLPRALGGGGSGRPGRAACRGAHFRCVAGGMEACARARPGGARSLTSPIFCADSHRHPPTSAAFTLAHTDTATHRRRHTYLPLTTSIPTSPRRSEGWCAIAAFALDTLRAARRATGSTEEWPAAPTDG